MSIGFMVVAVDDIAPESENYKSEDKRAEKALAANLARNRASGRGTGQIMNLLVREAGRKYEMVNGNHRLKELNRQGIKHALVFNVGKVSREEAYRIAIETNETSFPADDVKLHLAAGRLAQAFGAAEVAATTTLTTRIMSAGIGMQQWSWDAIAPENKTLEPGSVVMLVVKVPVGKKAEAIRAAVAALEKAGIEQVAKSWKAMKKPGRPEPSLSRPESTESLESVKGRAWARSGRKWRTLSSPENPESLERHENVRNRAGKKPGTTKAPGVANSAASVKPGDGRRGK